jgi:hypothetical protein
MQTGMQLNHICPEKPDTMDAMRKWLQSLGASDTRLLEVLAVLLARYMCLPLREHDNARSHSDAKKYAEGMNLPAGDHYFKDGKTIPSATFAVEANSSDLRWFARKGIAWSAELWTEDVSPYQNLPIRGVCVNRNTQGEVTNAYYLYHYENGTTWGEFAASLNVNVAGYGGKDTPAMAYITRFLQCFAGYYVKHNTFNGMDHTAPEFLKDVFEGLETLGKPDGFRIDVVGKLINPAEGEASKIACALKYFSTYGWYVQSEVIDDELADTVRDAVIAELEKKTASPQ